ncbi:hypothetical protein [Saccharothrix luteola]|uniref:hypothetical protein n=1 Tax=Saccharothrix luteola TaxID=2893018 RepID=UPI001E52C594|nr:hypothetical protein [Saccharothrix luteola]MCC8249398.1 hypothetical protein [Saccharothrix luteola]
MTAFFVQFPHPAAEHVPATDDMPWNVGAARRKFLVAPGRYLDPAGRTGDGDVVFWGEWEAPSAVERRWPRAGRLPRSLHRPYWTRSAPAGTPHDTDPWVFGDRMLYGYGKQVRGPHRRRTALQDLTTGSVICFGSTMGGEFHLDTVVVVADAAPWTPAEGAHDVSEAFLTCTAGVIVAGGVDARTPLTLYRGATADRPVHGMYSFVPARPAPQRFPRPPVRLDLLRPSSTQSAWGTRRPLPIAAVREAWTAVRDQVLDAGLVLATHLRTPERRASG